MRKKAISVRKRGIFRPRKKEIENNKKYHQEFGKKDQLIEKKQEKKTKEDLKKEER